jgi:hypothetical protein
MAVGKYVARKWVTRRANLLTLLEGIAHTGTPTTAAGGIVTSTGTGISGVAEAALAASVALTCNM